MIKASDFYKNMMFHREQFNEVGKRDIDELFKKYGKKGLRDFIKKEWSIFMEEDGEDENLYEKKDGIKCTTKEFGELMARVIQEHGAADSGLWEGFIPRGTEDRMWYRSYWCVKHGEALRTGKECWGDWYAMNRMMYQIANATAEERYKKESK